MKKLKISEKENYVNQDHKRYVCGWGRVFCLGLAMWVTSVILRTLLLKRKLGCNIVIHKKGYCKTNIVWLQVTPFPGQSYLSWYLFRRLNLFADVFFLLSYHELKFILFHKLGLSFQQQLFFLAWACSLQGPLAQCLWPWVAGTLSLPGSLPTASGDCKL